MATAQVAPADAITLYPAFGAGTKAVFEGRIIAASTFSEPATVDRRRDNLRRNLDLMMNEEREYHPVAVRVGDREWKTMTDAEGYFRVAVDDLALAEGWHDVSAKANDVVAAGRLLLIPADTKQGVISDVDDTIQITEVNSARRMLGNSFLLNPLQRQVVPGIVPFYRELVAMDTRPETAPVFYLSASPRQLHWSLSLFLMQHAFPPGILITKRVTNDETRDPLRDQFAYKTAKLEDILTRVPSVRFILVGDDGEHDPEIFHALRERFPDRVAAIWIRRVNPDPNRTRLPNQGVLNERLVQYGSTAVSPN
ncbi:MAG TPA: phosphatase domain-containing protein [Steroidobacteraceae bacterium]|nr:phosphatase domain-containing protein [Steroidobacteraceae bacterium]